MKKITTQLAVLTIAAALIAPFSATAKTAASAPAKPAASPMAEKAEPAKTEARKANGFKTVKVKSVDAKAKTITLVGTKEDRVLIITADTKFTKADGTEGKMEDIEADQSVTGSTKKTADGKLEAVTINIHAATEAKMAPKTTEKKPAAQPIEKKK